MPMSPLSQPCQGLQLSSLRCPCPPCPPRMSLVPGISVSWSQRPVPASPVRQPGMFTAPDPALQRLGPEKVCELRLAASAGCPPQPRPQRPRARLAGTRRLLGPQPLGPPPVRWCEKGHAPSRPGGAQGGWRSWAGSPASCHSRGAAQGKLVGLAGRRAGGSRSGVRGFQDSGSGDGGS